MSEPVLLPVKPGSLSAEDKAALRKAGVIVIEHDAPEELRLLRPTAEVDAGEMLNCALQALVSDGYSVETARATFTELLAKVVAVKLGERKRRSENVAAPTPAEP